jgi:hypothetical protein
MRRIFVLWILGTSTVVSCTENAETKPNSLEYFEQHLKEDMSHASLIKFFGEPVKDVGSGIHIYVYQLDDSTEIWIGITDVIMYANHLDKDGHFLRALI